MVLPRGKSRPRGRVMGVSTGAGNSCHTRNECAGIELDYHKMQEIEVISKRELDEPATPEQWQD